SGLSLVFFNGSDDASYAAVGLDGVVLDENGFAVVGNENVPGVQAVFNNGLLQNGPDAVAIMIGVEADFPNDTPIDVNLVVDALIYITGDNTSDGLLPLVEAGQMYVDEAIDGNANINALARIPDGGAPRITETYVAQIPTPGATNVLQCDGGTIAIDGSEETSIEVCVDEPTAEVSFTFESSVEEASYGFVVADMDGNIISLVTNGTVDFAGLTPGQCIVWGLSYSGELDAETTMPGLPAGDITAECVSFSINTINVTKTDCSIPTCQPGEVLLINGQSQGAVCINGDNTTLDFEHESPEESFELLFVLTTEDDEIIEAFDEPFYDFSGLTPGNCRLYAYVHQGNVDEETLEADLPASGIAADICGELTPEFIAIQKLECDENGGCTDLFISEYLEGTSNNKAIEVYNPTPFNIDLTNYTISTFNNGSATPTNQDILQGALAPGDVYVISHAEANSFILNEADETSGISWFNGNDAIALYNNDLLIDI
ncbi:MAG: lamin tail domain-containing protein, partial [Bacteroidota bacterium]